MTHCKTKSSKESPWQQVAAGLPRLKFHVRSSRNKHFPNTSRDLPGGQMNPSNRVTSWVEKHQQKESWLLQEKIKSVQKISLKCILFIFFVKCIIILSKCILPDKHCRSPSEEGSIVHYPFLPLILQGIIALLTHLLQLLNLLLFGISHNLRLTNKGLNC